MRLLGGQRIVQAAAAAADAGRSEHAGQQPGQGDLADPTPHSCKKWRRVTLAAGVAIDASIVSGFYSLVIVSSRLKTARAMSVQAARARLAGSPAPRRPAISAASLPRLDAVQLPLDRTSSSAAISWAVGGRTKAAAEQASSPLFDVAVSRRQPPRRRPAPARKTARCSAASGPAAACWKPRGGRRRPRRWGRRMCVRGEGRASAW